ncbi:MAG: GDSL-type esterase/lipase family protein [Nanoarchaeota archaeon]
MTTICVFGDSITWGAWDHEKGGWADRLKLYCSEEYDYLPVYNLGIDGDTSEDILERFENECLAREPDLIIISIGDNDSALKIPLKEFEENIGDIIELAGNFTEKIIFLGPNYVDESRTMPVEWGKYSYSNSDLQKYGNVIKKLCKENNLGYIDFEEILSKDDLEDGLHPNSKGHEKIFQHIVKFLEDNNLLENNE